jgi:hypothetical protein
MDKFGYESGNSGQAKAAAPATITRSWIGMMASLLNVAAAESPSCRGSMKEWIWEQLGSNVPRNGQ